MTGVPTIICKLSAELDACLTATARARRMSKSTIVREILEAKLVDGRDRKQLRAYDRVKHLVGRASGPRDLSRDPRHMRGFGQ